MIEPVDLGGHDVIGVLSNTLTSLFAPHVQFSRAPRKHPLGGCGKVSGAYREQQCWRAAAPKRFGTTGWFRGGQFFHGLVGSGDDSRASHLSIIITSAPPQITRHSIPEAGGPALECPPPVAVDGLSLAATTGQPCSLQTRGARSRQRPWDTRFPASKPSMAAGTEAVSESPRRGCSRKAGAAG